MTEAKANEIFRTKYPEGNIIRKNVTSAGNKYWVTFNPNSKAYFYSATSYAELLNRLGFKVVYRHNLETAKQQVEHYEEKINKYKKGELDEFEILFGLTEEQLIENTERELNDAKKRVNYYKNECIIID